MACISAASQVTVDLLHESPYWDKKGKKSMFSYNKMTELCLRTHCYKLWTRISPGEVLATRSGPLHHVGEADAVPLWQVLVVHVVELLVSKTRKKKTFPCVEKRK